MEKCRSVGEVFEKLDGISGREDKANFIRTSGMVHVFSKLFDTIRKTEKWEYEDRPLPEFKIEDPPSGYSEDNLANQLRRLYLFDVNCTKLDGKRKDEILIQMVESLTKKEASILIAVVSGKKLPAKLLTRKFIDDLYENKI